MANSPRAVATIGCADLVAAGDEVGDWTLIRMPHRAGPRRLRIFYPGDIDIDICPGINRTIRNSELKFRVLTDDPHSSTGVHRLLEHQRLVSGPLAEVALAVLKASQSAAAQPIVIFDDASGRSIDLDLRGNERDIV